MSGGLEVLEGGLQTLVQDLGRPGLLAIGVPASGALDAPSLRFGNLIAGNAENSAALEMRSPGPVLRVTSPTLRITLAGTQAGLLIERDGLVQPWASWRAIEVAAGDLLRVPPFGDTAVAYLTVGGGVDVPQLFGSRATSLRGGFGGLYGRSLTSGDHVPVGRILRAGGPCLTLLSQPVTPATPVLRVIAGPQDDHFTAAAHKSFNGAAFRVSRDIDRMGIRLNGPVLGYRKDAGLVSDGTTPGAVQVPGSGQPILLLADCQTTGGYPKIATVISADLPIAGRLVPGTTVQFATVDMKAAAEARQQAAELFEWRVSLIVPVRDSADG